MQQQVKLNPNRTLRRRNSKGAPNGYDFNLSSEHWTSSENTSISSTGSKRASSRSASSNKPFWMETFLGEKSKFREVNAFNNYFPKKTNENTQPQPQPQPPRPYPLFNNYRPNETLPKETLPKETLLEYAQKRSKEKHKVNIMDDANGSTMNDDGVSNNTTAVFIPGRTDETYIHYFSEILETRKKEKESLIKELDNLVITKEKKNLLKLNDYGNRRKKEIAKRNTEIDKEIDVIKEKMSKMLERIKEEHHTFLSQKQINRDLQNELNTTAKEAENELFLQAKGERYDKILENLKYEYDMYKFNEISTKALTEIITAEMSSNSSPEYITLLNKYKEKIREINEKKKIERNYTDELTKIEYEYNEALKDPSETATLIAYQTVLSGYSSLMNKALKEQNKNSVAVGEVFTKKFLNEFIVKLDKKKKKIVQEYLKIGKSLQNLQTTRPRSSLSRSRGFKKQLKGSTGSTATVVGLKGKRKKSKKKGKGRKKGSKKKGKK